MGLGLGLVLVFEERLRLSWAEVRMEEDRIMLGWVVMRR